MLTRTTGYDPYAGVLPTEVDTGRTLPRESWVSGVAGTPSAVRLRGWKPGSVVTAQVVTADGALLPKLTTHVDSSGNGTLQVAALQADEAQALRITDGVWLADYVFLVEPTG